MHIINNPAPNDNASPHQKPPNQRYGQVSSPPGGHVENSICIVVLHTSQVQHFQAFVQPVIFKKELQSTIGKAAIHSSSNFQHCLHVTRSSLNRHDQWILMCPHELHSNNTQKFTCWESNFSNAITFENQSNVQMEHKQCPMLTHKKSMV